MGKREASALSPRLTWPSFLRGQDASEILAHLSEGDPLHLHERTARRLRERWILLDPDRTYHRALAVCAKAAASEDPPEDLAEWAARKLDLAIDRLVRVDLEAEAAQPEILSEEESDFPLLTQSLMLEPGRVRAVSVAFNALDPLPRRAFFELLIEGRPVGECLENGPWDEDGLYEAIQTALATVNLDMRPDSEDTRKEKRT